MAECMPLTPTEIGAKDTPAVWQASHEAEVGICVTGLPVARVPLWHETQVPGATRAWVYPAGSQDEVLWHESQDEFVGRWAAGLPVAKLPLWQLLHAP